MACTLAALVSTVAGWCVVLYANHGSLYFRCGLLPTANDEYLDGSHRTFQQCTWHLGNSTRTWGATYGFKVCRGYVSMEVKHVNPKRTAEEEGE